MGNKIKELEKSFADNIEQFAPGSGFGDPDARRNAELVTIFSFLKLQAEQNRNINKTASIINFVILPLTAIQALFAVLSYFRITG